MAEVKEESVSSAKVKDLIFAYERHSSFVQPLEDYEGRPRSRSIGNALSYKLFREPILEIHHIVDIEKELVKIEAHLNYYEVYEKETHVAFQEQLFNILTFIVSIDPEGHESTIQKKKELIGETQKLARVLNSKLPYSGNNTFRGARRTYSNVVKREEAVVSTTSERTQEHKAILWSTFNDDAKSEESLSSTKNSSELFSRHEDLSSVDFNTPPTPQQRIATEEPSGIPSVSKLKRFFSFKHNDKPEIQVISAAYSGVTRTQSLNVKSNKYTVIKREKKEEIKRKEGIISENDEDTENQASSSSIQTNDDIIDEDKKESVPISLYVEPTKDIEEYRELEREVQHNVSVSKLKGLFEDRQKETEEGLGLLSKKQTEFRSGFNLPYTEANLGAFRLKRTISGNYMNFAGLLRNVDIHAKTDLNKSKSMSDLKSSSLKYDVDDLRNEVDDDDGLVHVSMDEGNEVTSELNNNTIEKSDATIQEIKISEDQQAAQSSETYVSGSVGVLTKSFEQLSAAGGTSINNQQNDHIKHVIYERTEPILNSTDQSDVRSAQVKSGFTHLSHSVETVESSSSHRTTVNTNEDIKHSIIKPIPDSDTKSKETTLKVPIHLGTGFANISHSKEVTVNSSSSEATTVNSNGDVKHTLHKTIQPIPSRDANSEEPVLKVPIQLRTGFANISHSEEVKANTVNTGVETASNASKSKLLVVSSSNILETMENKTEAKAVSTVPEPTLRVPVQTRVGVLTNSNVQQSSVQEIKEDSIGNKVNVKSKETIKAIAPQPLPRVPIQTSIGAITSNSVQQSSVQETREEFTQNKVDAKSKEIIAPEPLPRAPIQVKIGVETTSSAQKANDVTNEVNSSSTGSIGQGANTHISSGSVEVLKQTFENLRQDSTEHVNVTVSKTTVESTGTGKNLSAELVQKVPIQLKAGSLEVSQNTSLESESGKVETKVLKAPVLETHPLAQLKADADFQGSSSEQHSSSTGSLEQSANTHVSSGSVEVLKQTFENLRQDSTEQVNVAVHKTTVESTGIGKDLSAELVQKVPVQLKAGSLEVSQNTTLESESGKVETKVLKAPVLETHPLEQLKANALDFQAISNEHHSSSTGSLEQSVNTQISTGSVEVLKQTFENLSRSNSQDSNENVNVTVHKTTVESAGIGKDLSAELVQKVPIQLKADSLEVSQNTSLESESGKVETKVLKVPVLETHPLAQLKADAVDFQAVSNEHHSSSTEIVEQSENTHVSSGSIEVLKQTFENLSRSNSQDSNENVNVTVHKTTVESAGIGKDLSAELVLKVPIQLKADSLEVSQNTSLESESDKVETKVLKAPVLETHPLVQLKADAVDFQAISNEHHSSSTEIVEQSENTHISSGSIEVLKQTFENLSRSNSQDSNENVNISVLKTVESTGISKDLSAELVQKVPIQLRAGSLEVSQNTKVETAHLSESGEISTDSFQESKAKKSLLKVPVELRINENIVTYDANVNNSSPNTIPLSLYNANQLVTEETGSKENATFGRAQIENKTESFMKILESPTAFSTLLSNSSFSQGQHVSSLSNMSASYSEKRTVQQTSSTHVSHRIVSSSSSSQTSKVSSSKSYQVLNEPNSYSLLSPGTPVATNGDESTVYITEVEDNDDNELKKPKFNLNVSQECLLDDILQGSDVLENIDEEFKKTLEENNL